MRILETLKRFFRGPRSFESVVDELVEGLRDGSIYLDHLGPDSVDPPADPGQECDVRPATTANGTADNGLNGTPAPAPSQVGSNI